VTTVTATDADGTTPSYSLAGGVDQARFTISSSTGAVNFVSAPNFEAPTDSDANNSYVVMVQASDGVLSDTQTITVNVTDINEAVLPIVSVADTSIAEGGVLSFRVFIADGQPASQNISVSYATQNGTAETDDYVAASGVITILAGQVDAFVPISTLDDYAQPSVDSEDILELHVSVGATAAIGDGVAKGEILDDEDMYWQGDAGDDVFVWRAGPGEDTFDGDAGVDWVNYSTTTQGVSINLSAGPFPSGTGIEIGNDRFIGIENIIGGGGDDSLIGSDSADLLAGQSGKDTLRGGAGNDSLYGGPDDDSLDGGAGTDYLDYLGAPGAVASNLTTGIVTGGAGNDVVMGFEGILGSAFADTLTGDAGGNWLEGRGGGDSLYGEEGNDRIDGGDNNDTIEGGNGVDTLLGGAGDDVLRAGSGVWVDSLVGGVGDDIYELYNIASQVYENAGEGWDTVRSYAWSTTLWDNVEDLQLVDPTNNTDGTGNALDNILRGNIGSNHLNGMDGNDILIGNAGSDTLDGGNGSDTLNGGDGSDTLYAGSGLWTDVLVGAAGDDTYELYNVASQIYENTGEGWDTVRSYAWSTTLWDNVEDLQLVDPTNNTDGTGNALGNIIRGNAGNNHLNGVDGNDILIGNAGNDTLDGGNGSDTMNGGDGNDTLYAGSGLWTDVLVGAAGDDTYELYNVASQIYENAGEGTDTLRSYAWATTLPANVENLLLVDTVSDVNGTGNALNNSITGNAGNNVLSGLDGADVLTGDRGADTLAGGAGQDTFVLRPGDGGSALTLADVITDYQDGTDSIGLGGGLTYAGLTIAQGSGAHSNDTIIQRTATGEYLAVLQNVNSSVLDILDFKSISG
jgi:Ca2+-binding RTX toxin-like protein